MHDDARLLADLGDEDYTVRQAATRRLCQDEGLTQDDIDRLFVLCDTPEQRHRILRVARHHTIRRMIEIGFQDENAKGSMGLSHTVVQVRVDATDESAEQQRPGVMAAMTLPGFPAYASMNSGDVIIEFDGQPIPEKVSGPMFQKMIQGKRAGDTIDLKIVRNGAVSGIQMTLSNSLALDMAYSQSVVLMNPYRKQWAETRKKMLSLVNDHGPDEDTSNEATNEAPPQSEDTGP